ncbi:MAG: right-handed parallel beta-helix repeat-containing protein [Limnochordia bacterium]
MQINTGKMTIILAIVILLFSMGTAAQEMTLGVYYAEKPAFTLEALAGIGDLGAGRVSLHPRLALGMFDNSAGSLGLVYRVPTADYVLGANMYVDSKRSDDASHSRLGFGLEALSDMIDLRLNYYYPLSKAVVVGTAGRLEETKLVIEDLLEEPLKGFDAEISAPVPLGNPELDLRVGLGYHSLTSEDDEKASGIKVRLAAVWNNLHLEVGRRTDSLLGDENYLQASYSIPFGRGIAPDKPRNQLPKPVVRDWSMPVYERAETIEEHEMFYIGGASSGAGTLSSPHSSLDELEDDDRYQASDSPWIYLTGGSTYTGPFELKENAVLWGEGYEYMGIGGGAYPLLVNDGSDYLLTLAGNNRVMGLEFDAGDGVAIGLDSPFATSITIVGNRFLNGSTAVEAYSFGGLTAVIADNIIGPTYGSSFFNGGILINSGSSFNGFGAIGLMQASNIDDDPEEIKVSITNNTFQRLSGPGLVLETETDRMDIQIKQNLFQQIDNIAVGVFAQSQGQFAFDANSIKGISGPGVYGAFITEGSVLSFKENQVFNALYGMIVEVGGNDNQVAVTGNSLGNIEDEGLYAEIRGDRNQIAITANEVSNTDDDGMYLELEGDELKADISNNEVAICEDAGIYLDANVDNSTIRLSGNKVAAAEDEAFDLYLSGDGNTWDITGNASFFSGYEGFDISVSSSDDGGGNRVNFTGNSITACEDYGVDFYVYGDDNSVLIGDNEITGADYDCLYLDIYGDGNSVEVTRNSFSFTNEDGLDAWINGLGNALRINSNSIANASDGLGIDISANDEELELAISGNKISSCQEDGIVIEVNGGKSLDVVDNEITNVGGMGLYVGVYSYGYPGLLDAAAISGNIITGCGSDGIGIEAWSGNYYQPSSIAQLIIKDNIVRSVMGDGIWVESYTDCSIRGILSGNTIVDNLGDGIYLYNSGGVLDIDLGSDDPSSGRNSIYGNAGWQVNNESGEEVNAQHNWWGQAPENDMFNGEIVYEPYLEQAP